MSQTVFGMIIMTCLLLFCSGMAVWAKWPDIKDWCHKHRLHQRHR
nr:MULTISPECIES: hypothetical protein [Pseudomonas]